LQPRIGQQLLKQLIGVFGAAELGIKHLWNGARLLPHPDEVRRPHLSHQFVDLVVCIRKKRERDLVSFLEVIDLEGRVACTDSDYLDFPLKLRIALDFPVDFVDRRSLLLAVGSIHAEDLDDNHLRRNVGNCKIFLSAQA
jgi:hypothetical protein